MRAGKTLNRWLRIIFLPSILIISLWMLSFQPLPNLPTQTSSTARMTSQNGVTSQISDPGGSWLRQTDLHTSQLPPQPPLKIPEVLPLRACANEFNVSRRDDRGVLLEPRGIPDDNSTFLIYVHSTPRSFWRREMIRRTWGGQSFYQRHFRAEHVRDLSPGSLKIPFQVHVVFVMGLQPSQVAMRESMDFLYRESCDHNDILLSDFDDTYYNLTLKALSALSWATQNFPKVKYVVKADDDVMLNTYAFMQRALRMELYGECPRCFQCRPWYDPKVHRSGKWRISQDEYPRERYPTFCSGSAYLSTQAVLTEIQASTLSVPLYPYDDVYITGILAETLKVTRFDLGYEKFWLYPEDYSSRQLRADNFYVAHNFPWEDWEDFWYRVVDTYTVQPSAIEIIPSM